MTALGQAAVGLATAGYHVHPLRPRAKIPATTAGFKNATRDERRIREWWQRSPSANIGIACGASRAVVLDIDTKAGADPREILADVDRGGAPIIGTGIAPERSERYPHSLTGRRGVQVYFRGDLASSSRLTIPGVEIKGAGGYIVAPPSIHPSGVEYVGELPPCAELPPVPDWLRALVRPAEARPLCHQPRTANGPAPLDGLLRTVRGAAVGNRNASLFWAASRVAEHVLRGELDEVPALDHLHGAAVDAGLPEHEVHRTIASAFARGSVAA